jgi:hypothetical protein
MTNKPDQADFIYIIYVDYDERTYIGKVPVQRRTEKQLRVEATKATGFSRLIVREFEGRKFFETREAALAAWRQRAEARRIELEKEVGRLKDDLASSGPPEKLVSRYTLAKK